jgi:hypothetical protein
MTTAIINHKRYSVYTPRHDWDMNYHFIDKDGIDYLVDLQDVIDWKYEDTDDNDLPDDYGATIEDAIHMAKELANVMEDGRFYWTAKE